MCKRRFEIRSSFALVCYICDNAHAVLTKISTKESTVNTKSSQLNKAVKSYSKVKVKKVCAKLKIYKSQFVIHFKSLKSIDRNGKEQKRQFTFTLRSQFLFVLLKES